MDNIKIPNILTDLAHVGTAGLSLTEAPAVLKELEICSRWGYRVEQKNDRVLLHFDDDQIIPYWVQRETPDLAWEGLRVNGFLRIDSTNREALEQARMGASNGTLIFAEEQTAGRGRNGRSWFSPPMSGLYFSLIIRPRQSREFWPLLTHVASVALVDTFQELVDAEIIPQTLEVDIKWPNDVLISGKKCAGILLETLDEGHNQAVVIGVGINVRPGSVPGNLSEEAGCIDEPAHSTVPRRKILVSFLKQFQAVYISFEKGKHEALLDRWKLHSTMWDGVRIWIEEGGGCRSVVTCGLDKIGALLVRNEEGAMETIHAGDVRIQRTRYFGQDYNGKQ
jgi:BirA family biotin operon repressor/biotin-[acetyl-CoA-carboxylase] ligase